MLNLIGMLIIIRRHHFTGSRFQSCHFRAVQITIETEENMW